MFVVKQATVLERLARRLAFLLFCHEAGTVFLYAGEVAMAHHLGGGVMTLFLSYELATSLHTEDGGNSGKYRNGKL